MHSIFQIESLLTDLEVHAVMEFREEISFICSQDLLSYQYPVELLPEHRVIGTLVVYEHTAESFFPFRVA